MLPTIKSLPEGGQQIYNKNATAQGLVFIQIQDGYRTRENLFTSVLVDSYQYIYYVTTIHLHLKGERYFKDITSTFVTFHPNILYTLGLPKKYNQDGARFLQESERLQLNMFNQILSPQLMRLLGPRYF